MKKHLKNIALIAMVASLLFLYGFANLRNQYQPIKDVQVDFKEVTDYYIHENDVYKLLIQSKDSVNILAKENVNLKVLETNLELNDMIRNAQVYMTVDGLLTAEIQQRKPILRFFDKQFQYLDEAGEIMPLSPHYSARVPVAFGFTTSDAPELFPLAQAIEKDAFLKQQIISLTKSKQGELELVLRDTDFSVIFGDLKDVERKLSNLKVFFAKAKEDQKLAEYKKINLQFGNQVVCTKQ